MSETGKLRGEIAEEVRGLLGRRRIRPAELARRSGKSHMYWARRLNGVTPFDVDELEWIADLLGVGVADLLPTARGITGRYPLAPKLIGARHPSWQTRSPSEHMRPRGGRPPNRPAASTGPDGQRRTSLKV